MKNLTFSTLHSPLRRAGGLFLFIVLSLPFGEGWGGVFAQHCPQAGMMPPTVTTGTVTFIDGVSATVTGTVTNSGGGTVTHRGMVWATTPGPTTADALTNDGTGTGSFTSTLTGLVPGTTYHVRAFAANATGTVYGAEVTLTTAVAPTVTTTAVNAVTGFTASSGGNVTSDGGDPVSARGICYATTLNPTTADNTLADVSGTGSFTSGLTGLTPSTTYYLRAYATNTAGTAYGQQEIFTTTDGLPSVTTTIPTDVTGFTASTGGNVTASGGDPVTARGVCWATTPNPTTADNTLAGGSGTGSFTSGLTDLTPSTTYYGRAYATNTAGTAYGQQEVFTTTNGLPSVTTTQTTLITTTTVTLGGNVTNENGASVSPRGVCYSLAPNPTIADNATSNGSGAGIYSTIVTGLSHSTTYYVRAYATNTEGTVYGEELSFTTEVGETGISQHTCGTEGVHNPDLTYGSMTDQEGNVYRTIAIGSQVWMAENMKTSTYRNGDPILNLTVNSEWQNTIEGAWAHYNNNSVFDCPYGKLYNWYAVDDPRDLCPMGWHVPNDAEWTVLSNFLGDQNLAGGKMKSTALWNVHWLSTNESGFSGAPGGSRLVNGNFNYVGDHGYWWASSASSSYRLFSASGQVSQTSNSWSHGFSVRCVRD
jgi:uncharacterized protein (TIGR02145 family)